MNIAKKISILGCGWLGLPFAEQLVSARYSVNGSTTSFEKLKLLQSKSINPFLVNLSDPITYINLPDFLNSDILVVSFPPGVRKGNSEAYFSQIAILTEAIKNSPIQNILFISSTAVYPDNNSTVSEEMDLVPYISTNPLLQAEEKIKNIPTCLTTIVRFGGLLGGTRHPGRFFAGKTNISNPLAPVNLIYLDDCIGLLQEIIGQEKWGEIYNGVSDGHPIRQEFYTLATQKLNLEIPQFAEPHPNDSYKIISNKKVKEELNYHFIYPDPLKFPL